MFGSFILQFPAGHKVMWRTDVVVIILIVADMEVIITRIDPSPWSLYCMLYLFCAYINKETSVSYML